MRIVSSRHARFVVCAVLALVAGMLPHGVARSQEAAPAADAEADSTAAAGTAAEAAPAAEGGETQATAQEVLEKGQEALKNNDFPTAYTAFDQLARFGERDQSYSTQAFQLRLVGYTGRGKASAGMKEYEAALEDFKLALDLDEKFYPALLARGQMFLDLGDPENYGTALSDFQNVAKQLRGNFEAQFGLGKALILTNNFQAGIVPLTKVIEAAPEGTPPTIMAEAYRLRGIGYSSVFKQKEAIDDLNKSISLNPDDYETYVALGGVDFRNENLQGAIDQFAKAIEHYKPKNPDDKMPFIQGILTRSSLYVELGKAAKDNAAARKAAYENSRLEAEKVLALLDPKNPSHAGMRANALYTRAIAERMLGQLNQAVLTFSEAIELNADQSEAYYRRGICYHFLGEDRLAISDFTEAANIQFNDPRASLWLGYTHAKMGNYLDALRAYSDALAASDRFTPAYINRGLAYMALGEYEKALADFNDAVRLEPTNSDYYFKRGLAYEALGQHQKASESFAAAAEFDSKHAAAYRHLADAMQRLGRTDMATQYRQRATELEAPKKVQ